MTGALIDSVVGGFDGAGESKEDDDGDDYADPQDGGKRFERQGDGDDDVSEDYGRSAAQKSRRRSVNQGPSEAKATPLVSSKRLGKGLVSRFEDMFIDIDLCTKAADDLDRHVHDPILPNRSNMERSTFYTDEMMEQDCIKDWEWYGEGGIRDRVMKSQSTKLLQNPEQLEQYIGPTEERHAFLIGPAAKMRTVILKRNECISLDKCFAEVSGPQQAKGPQDTDPMDLDSPPDSQPSTSLPALQPAESHEAPSDIQSGWIINLGAKAHCMQWVPKWRQDQHEYLAVATRALAPLNPSTPDDLKEKVKEKREELVAEKRNVYLYPKPRAKPKPVGEESVQDSTRSVDVGDPGSLGGTARPRRVERSYIERYPPGAGALQIWRFQDRQTAEGSIQPSTSKPPILCAALTSSRWGHVRNFQICPFPRSHPPLSDVFIACVWSDGILRLHVLDGDDRSSKPMLDPSKHLLDVTTPAMELTVKGTQSMVACWYDGKTILSGNFNGSVTVFDIEAIGKQQGIGLVAVHKHDTSPIIFMGTCHPTYPSLIYTASLAGDIRVFNHKVDASQRSPRNKPVTEPMVHVDPPTGEAASVTDQASLVAFYSTARSLRFRQLSPTALSYYPWLNGLLISSHAHSDHALIVVLLAPSSWPQTHSLLRNHSAVLTCLATTTSPRYAHPGVVMGYSDGSVRVTCSSLVMKGLRPKLRLLTQKILQHDFSRVAKVAETVDGDRKEARNGGVGISRFLEGFPPDRGDVQNAYRLGSEETGKTAKKLNKDRAGGEAQAQEAAGAYGRDDVGKQGQSTQSKATWTDVTNRRSERSERSENVYEERASIVSVAWDPNVVNRTRSGGSTGLVALGCGSGLIWIQRMCRRIEY